MSPNPVPSVRRVINSLVAQQRGGRFVLGIDDAHLLDEFSAHVVHQLAQTREARLVVTLRTGSDEPDAVKALWKDGLLARLDLEPLSADAARTMVESALNGPIDARSAQRFFRLTGGNALFLQRLVKDQVAAGRIRRGGRRVDLGRRRGRLAEHERSGGQRAGPVGARGRAGGGHPFAVRTDGRRHAGRGGGARAPGHGRADAPGHRRAHARAR